MKKYAQEKKIDRKSWGPGPWDNEPDFYEWTTQVGYEAYLCRLDSGTWVGTFITPNLQGEHIETAGFHAMLRDKRHGNEDYPFTPGVSSYVDYPKKDFVEHHISMEHWEAPGPSNREWHRGPYKTFEDIIRITESMAKDYFDILQEGKYKDYFKR